MRTTCWPAGVGAGRHLRSGKNPRGAARHQRLSRGAGSNALADRHHHAFVRDFGAAHRVAVHRAVVLRRHLQRGHAVLCQHPAVGIEGGHSLAARQRQRLRQQLGERVVQWREAWPGHAYISAW